MEHIDTEIDAVLVEIDGEEYEVAPKTARVADQLLDARKRCAGQPEYRLWRAELEILLGPAAVRTLFPADETVNLDRLERVHDGVVRAFEHNHERLDAERADRASASLAAALAPLSELLRRLKAVDDARDRNAFKVIPKNK